MSNMSAHEEGAPLYMDGVNHCLGGFQLLESQLKTYLEIHFNLTRAVLAGRLHFGFQIDDFRNAALGRLVQVFSELCPNEALVRDLRAVVRKRDHIAHQALLRLYGEPIKGEEFEPLLSDLSSQASHVSELMRRVIYEMGKLTEGVGLDAPGDGAVARRMG